MTLISAASFIVEPEDLWTRRIARKFLDRAPRIEGSNFVVDGAPALPLSALPWRYAQANAADAWQRVAWMADHDISAEILLPTYAWSLFGATDRAYRQNCMEAHNGWIMDIAIASAKRTRAGILVSAGPEGIAQIDRWIRRRPAVAILPIGADLASARRICRHCSDVGLPVLPAPVDAPNPAADPDGFGRAQTLIVKSIAEPGLKMLLIGPGEPIAGALRVTRAPAGEQVAWGRFGDDSDLPEARQSAFTSEKARAFFGLP